MDMVISNFLKFLIKGETYPGKKQMIEILIYLDMKLENLIIKIIVIGANDPKQS